jgi:hypothetical protein
MADSFINTAGAVKEGKIDRQEMLDHVSRRLCQETRFTKLKYRLRCSCVFCAITVAFSGSKSVLMARRVGGFETTAQVLAYTLWQLGSNPDKQEVLRQELSTFPGEPTYEDYTHKLPYLDAVCRET